MRLPNVVSAQNWAMIRGLLERADKENHKRNRDVEIGEGRLILTSPNGTRYKVTVADDGTLTTAAL